MRIITRNVNEKDRKKLDNIKTYYGQKTETKALNNLIDDFEKIYQIIEENKKLKIKLSFIQRRKI